ncbi:hypothetical protein [Sphingomonas astaxanthinifaciens]|uniref:Uncharacterized protein n=1 Tax=Sphingomonas astaxanthinifaciens DSM 22298 TaxID=1123267 RepID=A0ABQ5Z5E4_9SPHN|nr:hypothetical protein [Sphingomonas astaxanthinifaciens]GLR47235.1 hypothetical protein GCM10007925_09460 [Sphingomonas astaxanthinifaciens DSM 22298]
MRQWVAAGIGALGIATLMWDNGFTAADWNVFSKGFLVGGVAVAIILGLSRRHSAATS